MMRMSSDGEKCYLWVSMCTFALVGAVRSSTFWSTAGDDGSRQTGLAHSGRGGTAGTFTSDGQIESGEVATTWKWRWDYEVDLADGFGG